MYIIDFLIMKHNIYFFRFHSSSFLAILILTFQKFGQLSKWLLETKIKSIETINLKL